MGPQDKVNRNVLAYELRAALAELGYGAVGEPDQDDDNNDPVVVIEVEKGDTGMLVMIVVDDPSREG